jgi:hypothetical protein
MLAAAVAILFAAAGASTWRDRVKSIQADNQKQQASLNLSREKLYAQYPTPEVNFEGEELTLGCGQSAPVALKGNFPKGTQFVLHTDDATYDNGKVTVAKDALPGPLEIEAISPVSGANRFTRIGNIDSKLELTLQYEDGWSAKVSPTESGCVASFSKGSSKRDLPCEVRAESGGLRVNVQASEEQQKLMTEQVESVQQQMQDPEFIAAQQKIQACDKQPKDSQMTCLQKAMNDVQAVSEKMQKKAQEQRASVKKRSPRDAWGCNEVDLRGGRGQLTGTANCEMTETKLKVTASYRCVR